VALYGFAFFVPQQKKECLEKEEEMNMAISTNNSIELKEERIQLVSFKIGNEEHGIDVLKVREIIRMSNITRVPNTPLYIEGVINLRGKVIPIISLRMRFNLPDAENDSRTRIIVMDIDNELMGFVVDSVAEVIRIAISEIQPPPPIVVVGIDQECISGVINHADRLLVLLDLEKIFSAEERKSFNDMI
jgi:purine-binding chemotaxis protein CheW